jgi:hypothetical protein
MPTIEILALPLLLVFHYIAFSFLFLFSLLQFNYVDNHVQSLPFDLSLGKPSSLTYWLAIG